MWGVFLSVGVLIPLLPLYLTEEIGRTTTALGVTILLFAIAGILSRPFAARYLRDKSAWMLMAVAAGAGALALFLTPLVKELWWLQAFRVVEGFTVGMFYVGSATTVVRLVPGQKQGSALSYFSIPLFLGTAIGPIIGDFLIAQTDFDVAWYGAGAIMLFGFVTSVVGIVAGTRRGEGQHPASPVTVASLRTALRTAVRSIGHPAARSPAFVIIVIVAGWSAFQALVPLYGLKLGLGATGPIFFVYSVIVISIRLIGAKLFDMLPLVETALIGVSAHAAGMILITIVASPIALYGGAALMAVAIALSYTTLLRVALQNNPKSTEEAEVVGSYSVAYDLGAGLGAFGIGAMVGTTESYSFGFGVAALLGIVGLVFLILRMWPDRARYTV